MKPFSGSVKYTDGGKKCDSRLKSRFSQKRYEIGPCLLWNVYKKSSVADRSVSVSMTLSDLERREAVKNFQADLLKKARTV